MQKRWVMSYTISLGLGGIVRFEGGRASVKFLFPHSYRFLAVRDPRRSP